MPVILQIDEHECGVACLAMIAAALGRPATLADCRRHLKAGSRGVSAHHLAQAASAIGLRTRAYKAVDREAVKSLVLPAIVHFGGSHFVVLESTSAPIGGVRFVDPALGRRRLGWPLFLDRYSGTALVFDLAAEAATPVRPWKAERMARLVRIPTVRALAVRLLAATAFVHLLAVVTTLLFARWVDGSAAASPSERWDVGAIGAAGLVVVLALVGFLRTQLLVFFGSRFAALAAVGELDEDPWSMVRLSDSVLRKEALDRLQARVRRALAERVVSSVVDGSWLLIGLLGLLAFEPRYVGLVIVAAFCHVLLSWGRRASLIRQIRRTAASGLEPSARVVQLLSQMTSEPSTRVRLVPWRAHTTVAVDFLVLILLWWLGGRQIIQQQAGMGELLVSSAFTILFFRSLAAVQAALLPLRVLGPWRNALDLVVESERWRDDSPPR